MGPRLWFSVSRYWLQRTPFYPEGSAAESEQGAQGADAIVWTGENLIVFIHELSDWY